METQNRANEHALGLDGAAFAKLLALLPLANYRAGETVLTAGLKSGRLLILKSGAVVILKDSIEIARVEEPGAVFGELSALLDQPHTADVRALETHSFTSPMQRCSGTAQLPCFTSRGFWPGVLSLLTIVLLS